VSDLLPTTLEFLGIKLPEYIKGVKQDTLQGTSLVYSFDNANAPARHNLQYYYIFGSRSIYKDGWKAEAAHNSYFFNTSRNAADTSRDYNKDKWELYNLNQDFNERIDLAAKYPEKLKELQGLFDEQAKKNNIYPFIDWDDVFKLRIHKRSSFAKPNQQSMINTTPPNPQK
jgi:arylsulfatase